MSKNGLYNNLESQLLKIHKHNNQGSFKTRERYFDGVKRFASFVADEYKLQKFGNISDKHLLGYVEYMKDKGLAASTIKTDLSAVRFFHDKSSYTKYDLSDNSAFDLTNRQAVGIPRAWSFDEYSLFKDLCNNKGMFEVGAIAGLAYNAGLRIHECMRIDYNTASRAVDSGNLTIKGKGGLVRTVPLNSEAVSILRDSMVDKSPGDKLYINKDDKTHLVIKRVQNFINRNRDSFQIDYHDGVNITFHGLRHSFASMKYEGYLRDGFSEYDSRLMVSELLGHHRDDVTKIYINKG